MIGKLIIIATYLKTRYESKKHGGYNIYEDDKIKIAYDTYYPNVDVYVKIDSNWKLVLLHNGHGFDQEYHPGVWLKYVEDCLYPKALIAKTQHEENKKERKPL